MYPLKIPIVNYHKIEERSDIGITARRPVDFENDLHILKDQGFQTIGFEDIQAGKIPSKPIMITFDDGYNSFSDNAFPLLLKNNMKAVIFIPTDFIGLRNNWDVHIGRFTYFHMDQKQIEAVSAAGMEIGSHTCSHRYLNSMDVVTLKNELEQSKYILEEIIGKNVLSLSYPFGRANQLVASTARQFYPFGVTLKKPANFLPDSSNWLLQRVNIYRGDSGAHFKKKLQAAQNGLLLFPDLLIHQGAWATIALQKLKNKRKRLLHK